jgi:hypothetical protein
MDPYYALACAVVEQTMRDLRGGNRRRRRQACEDIKDGGLDRWIRMVAGDQRMLERIYAKLVEVVREAA